MKTIVRILSLPLIGLVCVGLAQAQSTPPSAKEEKSAASASAATPAPRTDVYHVHFNHAAPGKAAALADFLKAGNPNGPMPGHVLVLRHQDGEPWDYVAIQHMGTKATVEAAGNPRGAAMKDLSDWHDDTFVNGPSWAEFAKAMGTGADGGSNSAGSVYVVSVYRPLPGHQDALEKFLSEPPARSNDLSVGNVLMQHLEGGAWRYLTISRYKSWQDFATSESNSVAQSSKGEGGWFQLREHISFHNDTVTYRIAP